ncbi:MAG: glutamate ligase domain-containing protein, partial [Steroidobacteraceae bacterium]
ELGRDLARRFAGAPGRLVLTSRRGAFPAQWRAPPVTTLVRAHELQQGPEGSSFLLELTPGARASVRTGAHAGARAGTRAVLPRVPVRLSLLGDFNVDNALTAAGVLLALDAAPEQIAFALGECAAPPGRMQRVSGRAGSALAIIDYAHKPDALAQALRAARAHCAGKLRVVFGCGGDRDRGKRPMMGRAASELADEIVLTDDNPRTEDPRRIVADIAAGIEASIAAGAGPVPVRIEHDRAAAIRETLARSVAGDVVLIAGKGHEAYQIVGTERRACSDLAVAQAFLAGSEGRA